MGVISSYIVWQDSHKMEMGQLTPYYCRRRLFLGINCSNIPVHYLTLCQYSCALPDTMPQFNVNFRTQLDQWKVSWRITKIKFEFENTKNNVKCVAMTEKNDKQYIQQIIYDN